MTTSEVSAVQDAIAGVLRAELARRNVTQVEVARVTGIGTVVLNRYFQGTREIPSTRLFAIVRAVGVPLDVVYDAAIAADPAANTA